MDALGVFRRTVSVVVVGLVALTGLSAPAFLALGAAHASPGGIVPAVAGTPGTPQPPGLLYEENFENGTGITRLPDYQSSSGAAYTADSYWLNPNRCNGFVTSYDIPQPNLSIYCNSNGANWTAMQAKAYALGLLNSPPNPTTNRVAASNTAGAADNSDPFTQDGPIVPPDGIQFETAGTLNLPVVNRFITFSVEAAATACQSNPPLLRFYLRNGAGTELPVSSSAINPCTDAGSQQTVVGTEPVSYGNFVANGSELMTNNIVGIVLRNERNYSAGNDGAFDDIRILDVTPQLDKSFSPTHVVTGGISTLTFTITNTSELAAKSGWGFTDALPAGLQVAASPATATTCPAGAVTAAPGSTSISATGDLSLGMASCTVSVNVTSPAPGSFTNDASNVTVTGLNQPGSSTVVFDNPGIRLVKSAGTPTDVNGNGVIDAGDTIPFSFRVENTGDVPLTGVAVNDPKVGAVNCPSTTIAVGASVDCTATYTITAADVAAGSVDNTATAVGTPPSSPAVTSPPSSTSTPVEAAVAGLSLQKVATPNDENGNGQVDPGETLAYTFDLTNTGNVVLTNLSIADALAGPVTCPSAPLPPGASTSCAADNPYTVTVADALNGGVVNTATAHATPPPGTPALIPPTSTVTTPVGAPFGDLTLQKIATPNDENGDGKVDVGETIAYSFVLTNNGTVPLTNLSVTDALAGAVTCPAGPLAPEASVTCHADVPYTVTEADSVSGHVVNTATAHGDTPPGVPAIVPPTDTITTPVAAAQGALAITIHAHPGDENGNGAVDPGETISYTFTLTNTGNVTLTDLTVADQLSGSVTCPTTPLLPGESMTCTGDNPHIVTEADAIAGHIPNSATGDGTPPAGVPPIAKPTDTITTPVAAAVAAMTLRKLATPNDENGNGQVDLGETITYTFTLTNTGDVTLTDLSVTDPKAGAVTCPTTPLAPAHSVTCTADKPYTVTAADALFGRVTNTATADATVPDGVSPLVPPTDTVITLVAPAPVETPAAEPPAGALARTGSSLPAGWWWSLVLIPAGAAALIILRRRSARGRS